MSGIISTNNLNSVPAMIASSGYVTKHRRLDMDSLTQKKVVGKPFSKNDTRINRNGRPRSKSQFVNQKDYELFRKYGIRLVEYNAMLEEQGGVCAICAKPSTKKQARVKGGEKITESLHVDHDHETGKVRGLVCYVCNTWVLRILDNKALMEKLSVYLGIRIIKDD